jgi:hypothetical protein
MIIGGTGRDSVADAFAALQDPPVPGLIGFVDSDFSQLDPILPRSSAMMATDSHDIETMIMASPALDKVVIELGVMFQ